MRAEDVVSPRGGIVRARRRPPGWTPPGPPAPPPADPASLWPGSREDLCWLTGDWRILQRTDGHRFSLDDLVTAHFAARILTGDRDPARVDDDNDNDNDAPAAVESFAPARLLDLGCGIGSVLLMLAWRFPTATVTGIEAQAVSADLARRSIAWNGAGPRCRVLAGDFRDRALLDHAGAPRFDLVTGTPPYFPRGTGTESDEAQRARCRFEHRGGVEAYAAAAARRIAPGAAFVGCVAASQASRVATAARDAGLALDRWRDVIPRADKPPLLTLFSMRHADRAPAEPVVELPLVVRDPRGRRTDEFVALRAEMGMPP